MVANNLQPGYSANVVNKDPIQLMKQHLGGQHLVMNNPRMSLGGGGGGAQEKHNLLSGKRSSKANNNKLIMNQPDDYQSKGGFVRQPFNVSGAQSALGYSSSGTSGKKVPMRFDKRRTMKGDSSNTNYKMKMFRGTSSDNMPLSKSQIGFQYRPHQHQDTDETDNHNTTNEDQQSEDEDNYFQQHQFADSKGHILQDIKVEDYNDMGNNVEPISYNPSNNKKYGIGYKSSEYADDYQSNANNNEHFDIKIPAFLERASLEATADKGQFYMTQLLSQGSQQNKAQTLQSITGAASKLKITRGSDKLKTSKLENQHVVKNLNLTQQYPINLGVVGQSNTSLEKLKKPRQSINNSLVAHQQVESKQQQIFNSTAPLNIGKQDSGAQNSMLFNNTNVILNDSMSSQGLLNNIGVIQGRYSTVGVNSTQNLKRVNTAKDKQSLYPQVISSSQYYSGVNLIGQKVNSMSPNKQQNQQNSLGKKQMLIQSILNQEAMALARSATQKSHAKYYLNLTMQKKQNDLGMLQSQEIINQVLNQQAKQGNTKQSRLNKTLDNLTHQEGKKRQSIESNHNYQYVRPQQKSSSKLSSTMRMSDFNHTQQIHDLDTFNKQDSKGQRQPSNQNKQSKNSLKTTQNLNLQLVQNTDNQQQIRKASVLSIYSSNIAQSTTSYGKAIKSESKISVTRKSQPSTSQHKKKNSQVGVPTEIASNNALSAVQEREMLKKMMTFYQDDFLNQQLEKRQSLNAYNGSAIKQNKHKANSTLNQYLQQQQQLSGKAATTMNFHHNIQASAQENEIQAIMFSEPPILVSKANKKQEEATINSVNHPYSNPRSNQRKNSTGSIGSTGGKQSQMFIKRVDLTVTQNIHQDHQKDIQNKTQPIPKSVLEIANQVHTQKQPINLSTGTSVAAPNFNQVMKNLQASKDSVNKIQSLMHKQANSNIQIASIGNIDTQNENTNKAQRGKNSNQPAKLSSNQVKPVTKKVVKQDNPSEVYKNKVPMILEEPPLINNIDSPMKHEQIPLDTTETHSVGNQSEGQSSNSSDGNTKLSRFILGKQIGQGAYAVVRIATHKQDNKKYAIKVYDKSKLTDANRQRSVRREIKLLQKMNHTNIVKIFDAFETDDNVYLVMEYVGGGSLHSYLREKPHRRLEEPDAKRIFKQIMTALQYCHKKSIAHRDIKLENILLDEQNNVKLIDFGFSTCIPNEKKIKMFCGTPSYMGPEIVMKEEYAGPPADIWASAVLLYALMNGCFPFRGATDKELYRKIQRGAFIIHNPNISDMFIKLLTRMLNTNADQRPTADDVLQDSWFTTDDYSNTIAMKSHQETIANEKRQFKAKILGKIPMQKNNNLDSSEEGQLKNILNLGDQVQNIQAQPNFQFSPIVNNNNNGAQQQHQNDFNDYGLQQQNIMKKLNQEAYQAYYNTSGGTNCTGSSGSATIQNPYYNNFFQNNYLPGGVSNAPASNTGNVGGTGNFYQNLQNNYRGSPQKPIPVISPTSNGSNAPFNTGFAPPFPHQGNHQFGSPTSAANFHCNGGLINNNFNIINNIIMNPASAQVGGVTQGGTCMLPGVQPSNHDQPISHDGLATPLINNFQLDVGHKEEEEHEQQNDNAEDEEPPEEDSLDEEILDNLSKIGFNRSQLVNKLGNKDPPSLAKDHLSAAKQIYNKLKEDKLSKTHSGSGGALTRAFSAHKTVNQQNNRTRQAVIGKHHNYGVFPNCFVPSTGVAVENAYYDDKQANNFSQSPKVASGGSNEKKRYYTNLIQPLFPVQQHDKR